MLVYLKSNTYYKYMLKNNKKIKVYSIDEARNLINTSIDQSAKRLQKRLKAEWKKDRTVVKKNTYAKATV